MRSKPMSVVVEGCFCGRPWPHENDEQPPPTCICCGRVWSREEGREGSAFTRRCAHEDDETCWHPSEVCEYWYSPKAHTTCAFGRMRKSRHEAEHAYVQSQHMPNWCDKCSRPPSSPLHVVQEAV